MSSKWKNPDFIVKESFSNGSKLDMELNISDIYLPTLSQHLKEGLDTKVSNEKEPNIKEPNIKDSKDKDYVCTEEDLMLDSDVKLPWDKNKKKKRTAYSKDELLEKCDTITKEKVKDGLEPPTLADVESKIKSKRETPNKELCDPNIPNCDSIKGDAKPKVNILTETLAERRKRKKAEKEAKKKANHKTHAKKDGFTSFENDPTNTKEGFGEEDFNEIFSSFREHWAEFKKNPTMETTAAVGGDLMEISIECQNIFLYWFVGLFYPEGDTTPEYEEDVDAINEQMNLMMYFFIAMYMACNWWFLFLYTDHYIDIKEYLKSTWVRPFKWIIGPVMQPVILLNYYLLGKRLQVPFYEGFLKPYVIENKSVAFMVFMFLFIAVTEPCAMLYLNTLMDFHSGKTDGPVYRFVLLIGCITYMYSVVFDPDNITYSHKLLSSILLVIIMFFIIGIFVIIACKVAVFFILVYLAFYSMMPLLVFEGGPMAVIDNLWRVIVDTKEVCVSANPTNDIGVAISNFLYKNAFIIYLNILSLAMLIYSTKVMVNTINRFGMFVAVFILLVLTLLSYMYPILFDLFDEMNSSFPAMYKIIVKISDVGDVEVSEDNEPSHNIFSFLFKTINFVVFYILGIVFDLIRLILDAVMAPFSFAAKTAQDASSKAGSWLNGMIYRMTAALDIGNVFTY